ncbi:glycosyltransferase family 4 protein [Photobacterium swingsii]|uniref:glycosyltransferase family 4 protein n=1 Tax=Photobacterium swingsii TaxID=680026 RepID=UPI004068B878
MKVCYIVPSLKKSGPLEVVFALVKELQGKVDIRVIALKRDDSEDERFYSSGVDIEFFSELSLKGKVKTIKMIKQDTIVHSHGLIPDILNVLSGRNNSASTLHAYPIQDYSMKYGWKGYIYAICHLIAFILIKKRFSCSVLLAKEFKFFSVDGINNGVLTDIFKSVDKDTIKYLKEIYGIPKNKVVFYFVGSLIKRKNIVNVIEAFNDIESDDAVLIIAGAGEYKEYVEEMAKRKTNVKYFGKVNNPEDIHKVGDVLLAPSRSEGFGLMVAEGLSCGSQVILSNIEIFKVVYGRDNMVTIIDSNSVENLKFEMQSILSNGLKKSQSDNYSATVMANNYYDKYLECQKS